MNFTGHLEPILNRTTLAVAVVVMLCTAAQADDPPVAGGGQKCALPQLASLPLKVLSEGQLGVPVTLAGKPQVLALSISEPFSYLYTSTVKAEGFETKNLARGSAIEIGKTQASEIAIVPEFGIGEAGGKNVQFAEFDDAVGHNNGSAGKLALNILSAFDVELDLANNRLNLFSHSHCPGNVVYWSDSHAELSFVPDVTGHPSVKMQLDGRAITVAFATTNDSAFMTMATAKRL